MEREQLRKVIHDGLQRLNPQLFPGFDAYWPSYTKAFDENRHMDLYTYRHFAERTYTGWRYYNEHGLHGDSERKRQVGIGAEKIWLARYRMLQAAMLYHSNYADEAEKYFHWATEAEQGKE